MAVVLPSGRATALEIPPGLNATQVAPRHISESLCSLYDDNGPCKRCRHTPLGTWSSVYRDRLYSTISLVLLGSKCCRTEIFARKLTIQQARAENGVFATQITRGEGVRASYYGLLAYADFGWKLQSRKRYRKGYTEVSAQGFWKGTVRLDEKLSDSKSLVYSILECPSFNTCDAVYQRSAVSARRQSRNGKWRSRIENAKCEA